MTYKCTHCSRTFATPYALKRHISDKHQYDVEDKGESSHSNLPYEEPGLWDDDDNLPYREEPDLWDDLPEESIELINYPDDHIMVRSR
jgi:hypothetical protein